MSAFIPPTPEPGSSESISDEFTWYKPEFPDDANQHFCRCDKTAVGRTTYWTGYRLLYRWQCRDHMPVEAAVYEAVTR